MKSLIMRAMPLLTALVVLAEFAAADMALTAGLADYQVLQCDENGAARAVCSGTWSGAGSQPVLARYINADGVAGEWLTAGAVENGAWSGALEGIPAGGPYVVEWRIGEEICRAAHVLAGDLWVLAGQSNMQGVGNMLDVEPPNPMVHMLAMNGVWREAVDPLHLLAESPDPVHFQSASEDERKKAIEAQRSAPKGAGLGLPFAREMARRTGRPVGLVCTAHGGTSMDQWSPDKRDEGGLSLYGSMMDQVRRAGGAVRGMLWYQGESDANPDAVEGFPAKFESFIAAVRRDFNAPGLPFYYVQIGRFTHPDVAPGPWNRVQNMQLEAEQSIPGVGLVAAIDLELDDLIHVGTPGLKRLGCRLANLAERDLHGAALASGPRPLRAVKAETPYGKQLRVTFSGVNGRLKAQGRPMGFSMSSGPDGANVAFLYKVELPEDAPDTVVLWVHEYPENVHIWYGRGLDPCANIVDELDMAMPVFGPLAVAE